MRIAILHVASVIGFLLCASGRAQIPEGYEVVTVANDLGIHSAPEIADTGAVVWSSSFPFDESDVWLFDNGVIRRISDAAWYYINPRISKEGTIIPWRRLEDYFDPGGDLVVYEGGVATYIPTPVTVHDAVAVSESGTMVFPHDFSGNFHHVELFRYDGSNFVQITNTGKSNQAVRANAIGDFVWTEYNFDVNPWRSRIMRLFLDDEAPMALTDWAGTPQSADINDSRQIVWSCTSGCPQLGLHLWEDENVSIVTNNGRVPRINDIGQITFSRFNQVSQNWEIWLVDNGTFQRVSDPALYSADSYINDRAELTWRAYLNDFGDTGVFMMRRVAPPGDINHDCHVDFYDFMLLQRCFTGAGQYPPGGFLADCVRGDMDKDGDIDVADVDAFMSEYTGPGVAVPGCEP